MSKSADQNSPDPSNPAKAGDTISRRVSQRILQLKVEVSDTENQLNSSIASGKTPRRKHNESLPSSAISKEKKKPASINVSGNNNIKHFRLQREKLELIGMIEKHWAVLGSCSRNMRKARVWNSIMDECRRRKHLWTKDKDVKYLMKSKWSNIKRDALLRDGTDRETSIDRRVLSFIGRRQMKTDDDEQEEDENEETGVENEEKGAKGDKPEEEAAATVKKMKCGLEEEEVEEEEEEEQQHNGEEAMEEGTITDLPANLDCQTVQAIASARKAASSLTALLTNEKSISLAAGKVNNGTTRKRCFVEKETIAPADNSSLPTTVTIDENDHSNEDVSNEFHLHSTILATKRRLCEARVKACEQEAQLYRQRALVAVEEANLNRLQGLYMEMSGKALLNENELDVSNVNFQFGAILNGQREEPEMLVETDKDETSTAVGAEQVEH